jgi:hypothetical protein
MPITFASALRRIAVVALLLCAIASTAAYARAQLGGSPIRLAVIDSIPIRDAKALVMREGAGAQPVTIFLTPASADLETLGGALKVARQLRSTHLASGRTELVPISGVVGRGRLGAAAEQRLVGILRRLEEQPVARIGNLGRGRWIEVTN